jgi:hypothetical protein
MKLRFVFLSGILVPALLHALAASHASAQEVTVAVSPDTIGAGTANLAFSQDGRMLREIQVVTPAVLGNFWSVRAITYDATVGSIRHVMNLGPNRKFFSATPDGRTAIISVNGDREDAFAHLLLIDMETGQTQDIPSKWFNAEDHNPYAQISADGRLVSAYSSWGPEDGPLVVTLYDWRTKNLIAKQATGYPAGGISWGGVTVDGKIEFLNSRTGTEIVDPRTGQSLLAYGPNSVRSPDGAWVVELAGYLHGRERLETIVINGVDGKILGKLDLNISDVLNISWSGVFCGTSGRFIAATANAVQAFEIPSGKKIADFLLTTWQDVDAMKTDPTVTVACSVNGKRVAIRSGARLTLHDLN